MVPPAALGHGRVDSGRAAEVKWWQGLGGSNLAYLGFLVAIAILFPTHSAFTSDDGALAAQVYAVADGTMVLERSPAVVPEENEAWPSALTTAEGPVPYPWGPAYIVLLSVTSVLGRFPFGLQIPSIVGAALVAAVAWRLTELVRPSAPASAPRLAFWVAATGPTIVNATALWGHTLAAGLCGVAFYCLVRSRNLDRSGQSNDRPEQGDFGPPSSTPNWCYPVVGSLSSAAAALVRDEAVVWALAVAVAALLVFSGRRAVGVSSLFAVAAVAAYVGERPFVDALIDRDVHRTAADKATIAPLSRLLSAVTSDGAERFGSAVRSLIWPSDLSYRWSWLVMALAVASILGAALLVRRRHLSGAATLVHVAAACYFLRAVVAPIDRISGLLLAWPVLLLAAFIGQRAALSAERQLQRLILVATLVYACGIFAVQHRGGAGLEWGGRYLSAASVGLAVVAALRLIDRPALLSRIVIPVMVFPALAGLMISYQTHRLNAEPVELVVSLDVDAVVSTHRGAARLAWSTLPQAWYVAEVDDLGRLLGQLEEAGVGDVALVKFGDDLLSPAGRYRLETISDDVVVVHFDR